VVSIARDGPRKGSMMNRRETYERPKPNMVKATLGCLWLLLLLGAATAVVTFAVVAVVRSVG
jgi:hypothetical protein